MKKQYIQPAIYTVEVQAALMLSSSVQEGSNQNAFTAPLRDYLRRP